MISIEAILSFAAYLGVIILLCMAFLQISEKAKASESSLSALSYAEACAFIAGSTRSSLAEGGIEKSFICSAESSSMISSFSGSQKAYSSLFLPFLQASASPSKNIKVIPKRHYG